MIGMLKKLRGHVSIQWRRVTDGQTDGQTQFLYHYRV